MTYTREDWAKAKAEVVRFEELRDAVWAPTKARYDAACDRLEEIEDDLGGFISRCEGCNIPIFEGDEYTYGEVALCLECSPTYQDMINSPESFEDEGGEPMTLAKAEAIGAAHVATGGSLADKML